MKIRTDIVRMYKEIHGWVGIVSGLALFIAFYAGAITMFEGPLQRWASPPARLAPPPSLERTPELIARAIAAHPEAAKGYDIHLETSAAQPARMSWSMGEGGGRNADAPTLYASLAPDGSLQTETRGPSPVAEFIDVLHQQVGLPFDHEISMPIMGAVSLLYVVAIVSGLIVLLPSLVKDLFAVRMGRNVKRMWLDMHNVLGVFSLPFHLVMALTALVFAFHDQFYDAQAATFAPRAPVQSAAAPPPATTPIPPITPLDAVHVLAKQAPGFTVTTLGYTQGPRGPGLRVTGYDPRYALRGATFGVTTLDPATGKILGTDYLPGHQDASGTMISSFFGLHFGNFGGAPVRWAYFLLGMAGAFLFYTGNLLWIESRRRRERKAGPVVQTRSTRILAALTVGVPLGCVAGISATLAAAKLLDPYASLPLHSGTYYAVFLLFVGFALVTGAARAGVHLTAAAALATLLVPFASLVKNAGWQGEASGILVDVLAVVIALVLFVAMRSAAVRARGAERDSVWVTTAKA